MKNKSMHNNNLSTGWASTLPKDLKTASNWFLLIPYGIYSHPKGLQKFTHPQAVEMVRFFKSIRGLIQRRFRGLPITEGNKQYGSIKKLEARCDGLWAKINWNNAGLNVIKFKTFDSIAPNWLLRFSHKDIVEPFRLIGAKLKKEFFILNNNKPQPKLNTQSITKSLSGKMNAIDNNRERFLCLVHEHMKKTGKHYLESWNTVKRNHMELFQSF